MERPEILSIRVGPYIFDALASGPEDGPLVILLHGWPEFASWWGHELPALGAAGYRALALEQRGYSPRARPSAIADYAPQRLVEDVLAVADQLGRRRFHLLAHDWGGMVAWALASAFSERLLSLSILSAPHPVALQEASRADPAQYHRLDYVRFFRQTGHIAERALLANNAERLRKAFGDRIPPALVTDSVRRMSEPGALTATLSWYRAIDDELTIPAARIGAPTLFIWGDEDMALGEDAALRTASFVDGPYRFVRLRGRSHWLPNECNDEILPIILNHLSNY